LKSYKHECFLLEKNTRVRGNVWFNKVQKIFELSKTSICLPKDKGQTTLWPKDKGQTTLWPKDNGQTTLWPKDKGQTTLWPKDKGQTTLWPKDKGQ
jgi:hypothetical protein